MFELLEHTADIGFRAQAASLPELFAHAAEALTGIAMETGNIVPRASYPLAAEGDSTEALLVNWLSEVLYYIDGRRLAMGSFRVDELDDRHVRGTALGEDRDSVRHPAKLIVKGITYHQLKVARDGPRWYCEVYLDI